MLIIRFFAVVIALLAVYMTHLNLKRKVFNNIEFLVWSSVWFCLLAVAVAPNAVYTFLGLFGSEYVSDLITIIAFIVIYLLGFYSYTFSRRQFNAVEQIVREMAILSSHIKKEGTNTLQQELDKQ